MSMSKAWWKDKDVLRTDKGRKFDVEYKKVRAFLAGQLDGTGITRKYQFAAGKDFGRQFDNSGLQGMQKHVRGVLCDGIISDLDIVNCHPHILSWICERHDILCPYLNLYIRDREQILSQLENNYNYDREDAKKLFLISTNSSYPHKKHHFDFLNNYDLEMKMIQKRLPDIKEYQFIKPKITGDNELGSFINLCLCYHENIILMKAYAFLTSKEVEICTLSFDGLMHYGAEDAALLEELNAYMSNEYINAGFKFVYKPHSKRLTIPKNLPKDLPDKSYIKMWEEFNKTHAKVGAMYICEDICGKKLVQTKMNMRDRYLHLNVYDREDQFIDGWLKNKNGTNMRIYKEFGLHPDNSCPESVYNLWEPFAYSLKTGDYEPDTEGLDKILHLVKVLANYDDLSKKFLLDWMAQMFQYPGIKPGAMPVLQSKPGAGKSSLIDILKKLLGESKVWECVNPQRDMFGTHNGNMRDAFLINTDEVGTKDFNGVLGQLKSLVTQPEVSINAKYQDQIVLPSYHRLFLTTNETFAVPTETGDRRMGIIAASNDLVGDKDFWVSFHKDVLNSERALRTFYDYLMKRPTKKMFTADDLPVTEYALELQQLSVHPVMQWLEDIATVRRNHWIQESLYNSGELTLNGMQAWDDYRTFCHIRNINMDKTNYKSFTTQLGIKSRDVPGVTNLRNRKVKVFDLKQLRQHFEITETIDEPLIDDPE